MKHMTRQKWMLSTLLIAALGSQYYFSTSSTEINSIELSSRSVAQATTASGDASTASGDATAASGDASAASGDASTASGDATTASGDATEATADAAAPACTDCVNLVVPREQANYIVELLSRIASGDRTVVAAAERPAAPPADETPAERRQREREERQEAERERRLENEEEFRERVEALVDRCSDDVECIANGFSTVLIRYSGRKQISTAVVRQAYREHIEGKLRDAILNGSDPSAAARALQALASDLPSNYRDIKTTMVDTVRQASTERANAINGNFRLASQLGSQNRLAESNQAFQLAMTDQAAFQRDTQIYTETLTDTLRAASDNTTLAYVQSSFIPSMQNLFSNLGNTGTGTTTAVAEAPRGTVRGGEVPAATTGTGGATALPAPSTTPGLSNAVFGTPGQGTRGGRGSY